MIKSEKIEKTKEFRKLKRKQKFKKNFKEQSLNPLFSNS